MDWPLSKEEKKGLILYLYDKDIRSAEKLIQSNETLLEGLRKELDKVQQTNRIANSTCASANGTVDDKENHYNKFFVSSTADKHMGQLSHCMVEDVGNLRGAYFTKTPIIGPPHSRPQRMFRQTFGSRTGKESQSSRIKTPMELDLCYDDTCEGDNELEPNQFACGTRKRLRRRHSSEGPGNSTRPVLHTKYKWTSQPVLSHDNYAPGSLQSLETFIGEEIPRFPWERKAK